MDVGGIRFASVETPVAVGWAARLIELVAENPVASSMVGAGALLVVIVGLAALVRAARARREPAPPREALSRARPAPHPGVRTLMDDAQELADRLAARLDAQAERMERLLEESGRRIEDLERALAELRAASREHPPTIETMPRVREAPARAREANAPTVSGGRIEDRVFALADEGLPVVEIARRVQRPTGQVELMLALRRG